MKFYLITLNKPTLNEKLNNVVTALEKKKFVSQYLYRYITLQHIDHYNRWCENHGYDPEQMDTVVNYVNTVWYEELNDYAVVTQKCSKKEMLSIIRTLMVCIPVGGKWEYENEIECYADYVANNPTETN